MSAIDLATDMALALDPARLLIRMGLTPDPWQSDLLRSEAARILLNCSRQSGKSTVTGALAMWEALYRPPALVLLLSPSLRQSQELFRKVLDAYRALGKPAPAEAESALRLELRNGSRIISLPGKDATVRGYSGVRLLIIDEASRVLDDLYRSVRPMLAVSGGRLVALSTPFGKRGWWFKEYTEGGVGWERVAVTADDCPRIPQEFLEEERVSLGPWFFQQEYMCVFGETIDSLFSYEQVMGALSDEVKPLFCVGV